MLRVCVCVCVCVFACACVNVHACVIGASCRAGAVTRSLFRCRAESWALAENVGDQSALALTPAPALGYSPGAQPMYVAPPTTLFPASPVPASLSVGEGRAPSSLAVAAAGAPLDGDAGVVMVVPVRAAGPVFDSGWFVMRSQSATQSYVQGTHGLATEPEQLLVSVSRA
jgi:hypothetical protein